MEDMDVIAYLYPYNDDSQRATKVIEANSRYVPPRLERTEDRYIRHERESTEPLENTGDSALDYEPCLEVRFSNTPRTDKGLIFGYHPKCDVVLPYQGISNVHFSLTFDNHNRPIVKDLGSYIGTEVTYNKGGKGIRSQFQWIVGGHKIPNEKKSIIITAAKTVSFQIIVPFYNITSPAYIDKVNRFNQGTVTTEGLLDDLGLSNPPKRPATGAHAPGTGKIYLTKELGEGGFGIVTHLWDVSTGDERVVKAPSSKAMQKRLVDRTAWHREARIMGQVSHRHIVRLIKAVFAPHPQLHLEYVPYGSLDDHENISYNETLMIVRQCLSALAYLHGGEMKIAHRDIKPANILVEYRFEDKIYVKLGDFGLSQYGSELMTICGTSHYLAPEVHSEWKRYDNNEERLGYTAVVDLWSLGVVACELIYGLPPFEDWYEENWVSWCEKIVAWLRSNSQRWHYDLGQFLLNTMVVLSPESRFRASDCYDLMASLPSAEASYFRTSA
ncbi:kinase-like domain-containing protein [Xylariaceae sp. FL0662B]|nr:kinase-like domain-containing protein [Xylariaceae sp. FL0662B]